MDILLFHFASFILIKSEIDFLLGVVCGKVYVDFKFLWIILTLLIRILKVVNLMYFDNVSFVVSQKLLSFDDSWIIK